MGDSTAEFEKYEALIENDLDETTDESEIKTEEVDFKVENKKENELSKENGDILEDKTNIKDDITCSDSEDSKELVSNIVPESKAGELSIDNEEVPEDKTIIKDDNTFSDHENSKELVLNKVPDSKSDELSEKEEKNDIKNDSLKASNSEKNLENNLDYTSNNFKQDSCKTSSLETEDKVVESDDNDTLQSINNMPEDSTRTCSNNDLPEQDENILNKNEDSNDSTLLKESSTSNVNVKQNDENNTEGSVLANDKEAVSNGTEEVSSKKDTIEQELLTTKIIEKNELNDENLQQTDSEIENSSTVKSETSSMCNVKLIKQPTAEKLDVIKLPKKVPVLKELANSGLESPNFNMWNLSRDSIIDHLEFMYHDLGISASWNISRPTLRMFLLCIREKYHNNPYHNFWHCFCVTQMTYSIVKTLNLESKVGANHIGSLITAAICHDVDHPGVNNNYLKNAQTSLAVLYNYDSVLEHHHFATACRIMSNKSCNILMNVENKEEIIKEIGELILATDLEKHKQLVEENKAIFKQKFEIDKKSHVLLMLKLILKCADVSNEVRPETIATPWVERIFTEHAMQFNREKTEGIKESSFMDPENLNVPREQISFIKGLLIPMYNELARYSPLVNEIYIKPLQDALTKYEELFKTSN